MLKIVAIGNLTNDVELKMNESTGKPYAILRIASDRRYKDKDGNKLTDFISIKVRGPLAERCAEFAWKGCKLAASGDFETITFEDEPERQPGFLIKATEVEFLSPRKVEDPAQAEALPEDEAKDARCITARYGQTTLSNHRAERSGVLLIKEATKKGYKEALPGDTVDLGYAGSNTRRGRVGHDIAHTLETSCIQGIVQRGGRIRRLMPRECLRLQGFEDAQIDKILAINSDAQAYKQAGNSVTVNVIEAIGRRIRAADEELKAGAAA